MEAVAEQNRIEIGGAEARARTDREWEEARARVAAYLRAWKLPQSAIDELIATVPAHAEERFKDDSNFDIQRVFMEEAEKQLHVRLNDMLGASLVAAGQGVSEQARVAILWAALPGKWQREKTNPAALAKEYSDGFLSANLAQQPQRLPETQPMTMQTSLTRLPSFRIVAGWFVLIVIIVLVFIFTR